MNSLMPPHVGPDENLGTPLATYPLQPPSPLPAYDQTPPPVPFDEAYISDIVSSRVRSGRDMVRRYYFALWNGARGAALEELDQAIRVLKNRLAFLLREVDRTNHDYQKHNPLTAFANWDTWAICRFFTAIFFSVVLAVASFAGVFQLLSSTTTFGGSTKVCLAVAAVVLAIPFAVELFSETLRDNEARIRINRIYAVATGILFLIFAPLLAITTGGNGAALPDPLSASNEVATLWGWPLAVYLQIAQLLLETVASLACFSYAAMLYAAHKTRWKAANPVCRLLVQRAATALAVYDAENRRLGELQGRRRALLADRSTYVFHAVGIFLHKADMAKRQGSGMARKQGADGRPSIFSDSPLKRAFDRVAEYFNN
jgi:hypothetical protein